jgi:hypothetical protein
MESIPGLSTSLQPVLTFEVSRGNRVARIDRPAGSRCPLAVILERPLDFVAFRGKHALTDGVRTWENRDSHYPLEAGYVCEATGHAVVGPIDAPSPVVQVPTC